MNDSNNKTKDIEKGFVPKSILVNKNEGYNIPLLENERENAGWIYYCYKKNYCLYLLLALLITIVTILITLKLNN